MPRAHPKWFAKAMASGGRAWQGEGDTGQYLRDKADEHSANAKKAGNDAAMGIIAGGTGGLLRSVGAKVAGRAMQAAGYGFGALDANDALREGMAAQEASDLAKSAEGRRHGGKVKKRSK